MIFCKLIWSNIGIIPICCKLDVPSSIFNALCQKVSILIEVWELYSFFDWSYFVYIKVNKLTFYNFYHFLGFFCLCKAIKKKFKSFPFFYWHLVVWRLHYVKHLKEDYILKPIRLFLSISGYFSKWLLCFWLVWKQN